MTPPDEPLTDEQAEAMLARLRRHYRQPVMPIRRYCDALTEWSRRASMPESECSAKADAISLVFLAIKKSNLLWRILYAGEEVRERPCPEHKGHWRGLPWEDPPCGCGLTGWLPNDYADDDR